LEKFVADLEKVVDAGAHKAVCTICADVRGPDTPINTKPKLPEQGIDRGDRAKKLIKDKVKRLEELAMLDEAPKGEESDFLLAKALELLRVKDATGKTGGKMLGVVICRDKKTGEEVLLWGYSGTLNSFARQPDSKIAKTEQDLKKGNQELLDADKDAEAKDKELTAAKEQLAAKLNETPKDKIRAKEVLIEARQKDITEAEQKLADLGPGLEEQAKLAQQEKVALGEPEKQDLPKKGKQDVPKKLGPEQEKLEKLKKEAAQLAIKKNALAKVIEGFRADIATITEKKELKEDIEAKAKLGKRVEDLSGEKDKADKTLAALNESWPKEKRKLEAELEQAKGASAKGEELDKVREDATKGKWVRPIGNGQLKSAGGETISLESFDRKKEPNDTPHGVCSAPKMIQHAMSDPNLEMVSMAEAWYGGGETNTHGELVVSCKTCMNNIGFQFCKRRH
jgi:hypothetical protein